jgi:eukaryotic-like serine/threonine-protein kinase
VGGAEVPSFQPGGLAELRERFLVEARAAAALAHPNICVIHEVGEDEGQPFLAMEYVEGETLRQRIKRGPLGTDEAVALMAQIAAGLEEAHRKGIIHRDIKSSNIMVTAQGQAKVMDFGLAKLRGGPELTKTQTTLGTVAYMSPEQAGGEQVDHRTDLWSAGVVLYEMVTGELPFQGQQEAVIVHAILYQEAKSLKHRTPAVAVEVQEVVGRALKKKPQARYGSAGEMLADSAAVRGGAGGGGGGGVERALALAAAAAAPGGGCGGGGAGGGGGALGVVCPAAGGHPVGPGGGAPGDRAGDPGQRSLAQPGAGVSPGGAAERYIPKDPKLAELFGQVSLNIDVLTDPPGASVFVKEYATPEAEWAYLGVTPLEQVRMPIGVFRWKLEKEGYETVLAAATTWNPGGAVGGRPAPSFPTTWSGRWIRWGTLPPGMVRVPATETAIGTLGTSSSAATR